MRKHLSGNQHADQTEPYTETALSTVVSLLETQVGAGGFAIVSSIDIEGAFNTTSTTTNETTLRRYQVP